MTLLFLSLLWGLTCFLEVSYRLHTCGRKASEELSCPFSAHPQKALSPDYAGTARFSTASATFPFLTSVFCGQLV
jgi:hypothetical protein